MLQDSPLIKPSIEFDKSQINLTTQNRVQKEVLWYLGDSIPSLVEGLNNGTFDLKKLDTPGELMHFIHNQATHILPGAILISDNYLGELKSLNFADLRVNHGLVNVPVIFLCDQGNIVDNHTISSLGIDGYLSSKINFESLIHKINFSKKIRKLKEKPKRSYLEKRSNEWDSILKRTFDIVFSGMALLILFPIFMVIAILIKLDSRGPVFYISKRAGSKYKVFNFYKFRTMVQDADKKLKELSDLNQYNDGGDHQFFKIQNDPRITKLGRFLRNTSIDELPQLINILKGDMSIVGNRPLPLYEAETLTADDSVERFLAPSGLTGLWQVRKRGTKEVTNEERIALDKAYARKHTFMYDIKLILETLPVFIQKESV